MSTMSPLESRLEADLTTALRAGEADRKRTLRSLKAALQYAAIEAAGKGGFVAGDHLDQTGVEAARSWGRCPKPWAGAWTASSSATQCAGFWPADRLRSCLP